MANDFYGGNPETLFIAPNCGLEIKLDKTEYGKEFGYEYEVTNVKDFPLLNTHPNERVKGWLSPTRSLTLPEEAKTKAGIPPEATHFAYLYPPRGLAEYINWDQVNPTDNELKARKMTYRTGRKNNHGSQWALPFVATFGGYAYFGENLKLLCVNAISFNKTEYKLTFEGPFIAKKNSYREIHGLNRYQSLYLDVFREVDYIGSAWMDPEDYRFIDTEAEGQSSSHVQNRHGGFLYFRHDKTAVIFLVEFTYEMETPSHGVGSLVIDAFRLCKHELRKNSSLSVTCPTKEIEDMHIHQAAQDGSKEHISHYIDQSKGTVLGLQTEKDLFLTEDSFGWLPLHYACCYHAQDYELIKMIVDKCPEAVLRPNKNNLCPIHLACHHNTSTKVIEILLEKDPNKITLKTKSKHHEFLPLHYACSNEKTSIEVIRTLILEHTKAVSEEGKIGCTPLHMAIAENHNHRVIELLLRYGYNAGSPPSSRKTNPVLLEPVNGMLPIHLACLKGCSVDIVSLLLEADVEDKCFYSIVEKCIEYDLGNSTILHIALHHSPINVIRLLLMREVKARCVSGGVKKNLLSTAQNTRGGMFPIHVACKRKDIGFDIIETLLRLERGSIFFEDGSGNRPLHYICGNKDADEKVVKLLLEAEDTHNLREGIVAKSDQSAARSYNTKKETPLCVAVKAKAIGAHALLQPKHICLRGMKGAEKEKLLELVLESTNVQRNVVDSLAQRQYFTFIMLELIANIAATIIYFNASQRVIIRDAPIEVYESVSLIICTSIFILRELIQLSSGSFSNYISDGWNGIEISSIAALLTATLHMIQLREDMSVEPVRPLFIISGILLLLQFIFIVRTTFLPFARFVAGLLEITFSLFPFLVVSMMLLLTFTYSYLVSGDRVDECPDFGSCLLWTLESFFYGMDGFSTTLDVLFGLVAVVVLLNVVIAIVSNAWDDSVDNTREVFWQSRVEVLFQYNFFYKRFCKSCSIFEPFCDFLDKTEDTDDSTEKNREKKPWWKLVISVLIYTLWFIVGFVTLGLLWPSEFRRRTLWYGIESHEKKRVENAT